jgi:hypothetical protein
VAERLPDLIEELDFHAADSADEEALRLALKTLIDGCSTAVAWARSIGYPDLAYIAAANSRQAADVLDDPVERGPSRTSTRLGHWWLIQDPVRGARALTTFWANPRL